MKKEESELSPDNLYMQGEAAEAKLEFGTAAFYYEIALDTLPFLAKNLYDIAIRYEQGDGVEKNNSEALRLLELAAKYNHTAQIKLGMHYAEDKDNQFTGIPKAIPLLLLATQSASQKIKDVARFNLAWVYSRAYSIPEFKNNKEIANLTQCEYLFRCIAPRNVKAVTMLGKLHERGVLGGSSPEIRRLIASKYYKQAADRMWEKDFEKALKYCKKSAQMGLWKAQMSLGELYKNGHLYKLDPNPEQAFKFFKAAAIQGYPDAQYQLGICYEQGIGASKDEKEAVRLYHLAAEAKNPKCSNADAQYKLGDCYAEAQLGLQQDLPKALKYYELAAEKERAGAEKRVAVVRKMLEQAEIAAKKALTTYSVTVTQNSAKKPETEGVILSPGK